MIRTLTKVYAQAQARWTCRDDQGDGTLSTVIIIAGFVTLAIAIVALVTQVADNYKAQIH